jgi:phosphoribosylaminoimidazole-succinocarboxamide synthase
MIGLLRHWVLPSSPYRSVAAVFFHLDSEASPFSEPGDISAPFHHCGTTLDFLPFIARVFRSSTGRPSLSITLARKGKVRDVYEIGDHFLMVATDRISAFDWVLPTLVPDKGRVLNQISLFWFEWLGVENHIVSTDLTDLELPSGVSREWLQGRAVIVRKCRVAPIECVVRGYLAGSGYRDYLKSGTVCGIGLEPGLKNCDRLAEPIFTPATKAESGHDENISFEEMCSVVGTESARWLKDKSIGIYTRARDYAASRGVLLADTKMEWGWFDDRLILIDEVLTPDSSRYWPADQYSPGRNQPSFDKQFVRDYLETTGWDKNSEPPELPEKIVAKTREKYIEAFEILTGQRFPWR